MERRPDQPRLPSRSARNEAPMRSPGPTLYLKRYPQKWQYTEPCSFKVLQLGQWNDITVCRSGGGSGFSAGGKGIETRHSVCSTFGCFSTTS